MKRSQVKTVVAAARFLAAVIEKCPELLTSSLWDTTIISLASWMLTVKNSRNLLFLPSRSGILPLLPKTLTIKVKERSCESPGINLKLSTVSKSNQMAESFCMDSNNETVFALAIFHLYKALSNFLTVSHDNDSGDVKMFHEKLKTEWLDVFSEDVHEAVVSIFYSVTGKCLNLNFGGVLSSDLHSTPPFNICHFKNFSLIWFHFLWY